MTKITRIVLAILVLNNTIAFAQEEDYIQGPALGIHFILNDFKTASNIRTSTLSSTLANKRYGKIKDMSPGLAISFSQGLSNRFDVSTTIAGSFLDYPRPDAPSSGSDKFLIEADASIRGKMFTNKYWVTPFLQAGVGVSKFEGYYGAFMPLGVGLQVNFFDQAFLLINSQYRVPVTQSTNYHFYGSIGLVGTMGNKQEK